MALTFLTKYNYGLQVGLAILVSHLAKSRGSARWGETAALIVSMLVPTSAWVAWSPAEKIRALSEFVTNRTSGLGMLEGLAFYPQSLLADYTTVPVLGIIAMAALVLSLRDTEDYKVRAVVSIGLFGLLLAILHPYKQTRFIYTTMPALFVLVDFQVHRLSLALSRGRPRRFEVSSLAVLVVAVLAALPLPGKVQYLGTGENDALALSRASTVKIRAVLDFIRSQVVASERVIVVGVFNELSANLVRFDLERQRGHPVEVVPLPYVGAASRASLPAGPPHAYEIALASSLGELFNACLVGIEVNSRSKFYTDDYVRWNAWQAGYLGPLEKRLGAAKVVQGAYDEGLMLVKVDCTAH